MEIYVSVRTRVLSPTRPGEGVSKHSKAAWMWKEHRAPCYTISLHIGSHGHVISMSTKEPTQVPVICLCLSLWPGLSPVLLP